MLPDKGQTALVAKKRLYARVAEDLASDIVRGVYAVGERMPSERDLAAKYEVSRPTIREAMSALEVDGLVDVVMGSGVYVQSDTRRLAEAAEKDVGPFELLEARALIEGEAAALAASHITPEELQELEDLLVEMEAENEKSVVLSEDADRRFHTTIARATRNSVMAQTVEALWEARNKSLQSVRYLEKARAQGIKPRIDEHTAIFKALKAGDPKAARAAMRTHLRGVANMVFEATEAEALERARSQIAGERRRFQLGD